MKDESHTPPGRLAPAGNAGKLNPYLRAGKSTGLFKFLLMGGLVLAGALILWFRFNAAPGKLGKTFPYDFIFYYFPMMEYAAERLARGEVPLWNPYQCCGVPFLATSQVAVFYPGTWLAIVLPTASALKVLMFGEVFLGGLFACLYFRALGMSYYAAGLGGVLFIFACLLGQTFWPPEVSTILWIPFLFLCAEKLITSGKMRWWAGFTLGTTLQVLAGFPQFLVYGFYLLAPYAVVRSICLYRAGQFNRMQGLGRCVGLGSGALLALGLAGVHVLPVLELAGDTVRSERLAEDEVEYLEKRSPWKPVTLTRLVDNVFDPSPKWASFDISGAAGYVGMATLFVIALGIVGRWRCHLTWFFLIAAVVSLILSFGYQEWSRGAYKLYAALPTGGMFRTPSRFRLLTLFSLIVLAVFGIDHFRAGFSELRSSKGGRFAGALAVVGLLAATFWFSSWFGIGLAAATAGVLVGSFFLGRRRPVLVGLQGLLLALVVFDLAHATGQRGSLRDIPAKWGQCFHYRAKEVMTATRFSRTALAAGYDRVGLYNLRPMKPIRPLQRAYTISDYEALVPKRWVEMNRAVKGNWRRPMYGVDPKKFAGLYDVASVKFFIAASDTRPRHVKNRTRRGFRFNTWSPEPAPPYMRTRVYPNEDALPRAYLVGRYELCEPAEALSRVAGAGFDYRTTVLLERDPYMDQLPQGTRLEPAEIVSYAPERVVIRTGATEQRILVLTDTYFQGWKVYVDGIQTEIFRANYLFRAVRVPGGRHEVVFEYRPASVKAGVMLSGASLVVFVALCAVGGYLSRRRRRTQALPAQNAE